MIVRIVRAGLAVVLAAVGVVGESGSPAMAAGAAGYCPDASGVTVVVDFNELGGGTVVRCARGEQSTGLTALKSAGFLVTGTLRWGEGFVCRIEGKPSAAAEKCVDTPPASAYWSYWHAANGGSWTYSDKGVLNRKPPAGTFEGWSFSLNRTANDAPRPGIAPKRPSPPPPPTTGGAPVTPPAGGGPVASSSAAGGGPGSAAPTTRASGSAAPSATTPVSGSPETPGAPATAPPTGGSGGPSPGDSEEPVLTGVAAPRDDGGVPLGTVTGVLLLAALAAGGVIAARRRRAVDQDD
ncbi:hypothetical protein [Micromonospora carbonacea]|uniref:hypothetical protein n=1 Tax=Micromonospora carbonacea TaxID=47853 RepID=UPI001797DDF8|nr:hypothetical protein [Micromonospora carbonacea]